MLSGNQRLAVLRELGFTEIPCIVAELDDVQAMLLAQALNRVHGEDNLGLRAQLIKNVLAHLPEREVTAILPETAESLLGLAAMGQ